MACCQRSIMATAEAQAQEDARPCHCSYHTCTCQCCSQCLVWQRRRAAGQAQQQPRAPSPGGCLVLVVFIVVVVLAAVIHWPDIRSLGRPLVTRIQKR